jgi:hypothetical protein
LLSVKLLDRLFAPTFPSAIMQMLFWQNFCIYSSIHLNEVHYKNVNMIF